MSRELLPNTDTYMCREMLRHKEREGESTATVEGRGQGTERERAMAQGSEQVCAVRLVWAEI